MISRGNMRRIAKARLKDAQVLCDARRYDGAVYLAGYAVELALKARICTALQWKEYPFTNREFQDYKSFKTHTYDVLLKLTGAESRIKARFMTEWSAVAMWEPAVRYKPVGSVMRQDAELMVSSSEKLMKALSR